MKPKSNKRQPELRDCDTSLKHLADDISKSVNAYLERGLIHYPAALGIMEDQKLNFMEIMRQQPPKERASFKDSGSYIG